MSSLIVFIAQYFFVISIVIVAVYWLISSTATKIRLAWQIITGGILALILGGIAGRLYYDPRPFVSHHLTPLIAHAADNGFPSDHALLTSFLGFMLLIYSRRVGIILLIIALLVGSARVVAHIHSPIDIVGSFVISVLAVFIVQAGTKLWESRRRT